MFNRHESYVVELGFELTIPGSAIRLVTDCTREPGMVDVVKTSERIKSLNRSKTLSPLFDRVSKIMKYQNTTMNYKFIHHRIKVQMTFIQGRCNVMTYRCFHVDATLHQRCVPAWERMQLLRKYAYSNILKISPPKTESFQIKKSDILYFCSKHRLPRRF